MSPCSRLDGGNAGDDSPFCTQRQKRTASFLSKRRSSFSIAFPAFLHVAVALFFRYFATAHCSTLRPHTSGSVVRRFSPVASCTLQCGYRVAMRFGHHFYTGFGSCRFLFHPVPAALSVLATLTGCLLVLKNSGTFFFSPSLIILLDFSYLCIGVVFGVTEFFA